MPNSFSVVICHGSYHTPEPYQPFIAALKRDGIEAYCPQLPSSDLTRLNVGELSTPDYDREPPGDGYPQPSDDVVVVNELLTRLIVEEGKNIVLLGHSSGGFTATAAAVPQLLSSNRKLKGDTGGIIGIFYECAFVIPVGDSIHSFFQPKDGSPPIIPPFCVFHKNGFEGLASTTNGAKYFFDGLSDDEAKHYESTLTASAVPKTVLHNDAYIAVPCVYLVAENDLALPAPYQGGMVALQNMRPGVDIKIVKCPSGHSPHLACTDMLVTEVKNFGNSLCI